MDLTTARDILGVAESASLEEIRGRYRRLAAKAHPDVSGGDARKFILLSTAFTLLRDHLEGASRREESPSASEDVLAAATIREGVAARFRKLRLDYEALRDERVKSTTDYMTEAVNAARSGSTLKKTVTGRIGRVWTEMNTQIEGYVHKLVNAAATDERDFLYHLFTDVYEAHRRHWLGTLYRNSVLIVSALLAVGFFLASPQLVPSWQRSQLMGLAPEVVLPLLPIAFGAAYVLAKLWLLNPRHQFVPPRLSAWGVHTQLREIAKTIAPDSGELSAGGAVLGGIVGTVLLPGVGTAIGFGVGFVWGLLTGENLAEMKARVQAELMQEVEFGVRQLDDRLLAWLRRHEEALVRSATESFLCNMRRVARLLEQKPLARQIAYEARLLLEPPKAPRG